MKAEEAREIAENTIIHLPYILGEIRNFANNGQRALLTNRFKEETIIALIEMGYTVEKKGYEIYIRW